MSIKIWLDSMGVEQSLLNGSGIESIEHNIAYQKLTEIQGQFIVDFGIEGKFEIKQRTTHPSAKFGTSRTAFMIIAADKRTAAILKRHPGWLSKFSR